MAAELSYFKTALAAFAKSAAKFDVVCSVGGCSSPTTAAASPLAHPTRPRSPVRTLVILDSSFNPPTVAHMQMATSAIRDLQPPACPAPASASASAMRLLLLLSVNNADKAPKPAAFEQRLALMLAMARDVQAVVRGQQSNDTAPDIDIGLTSEPYFHSKSNAIAESSFYESDAKQSPKQVYLVGYDTLVRIFDPKYYKAPETTTSTLPASVTPMQTALTPLMRRARLRVTTRPDDQWGDEASQRRWLQGVDAYGGAAEHWASKIDLLPGAYTGEAIVSSTTARAAAKARDWTRLAEQVGPSVAAWVQHQQLYSEA